MPLLEDRQLPLRSLKARIEATYEATFGEPLAVELLLHPAFLPAMEVALPLSEPIHAVLTNLTSISVKAAPSAADADAPVSPAAVPHDAGEDLGAMASPEIGLQLEDPAPDLPEFVNPSVRYLEIKPPTPICGLSAGERQWMREVNRLSDKYSTSGFGSFGRPGRQKLLRQARFLRAAAEMWPEFGTLLIRDGQVVTDCAFWQRAKSEYYRVFQQYIHAIEYGGLCNDDRHQLLADIGFNVVLDLISGDEEGALLSEWRPGNGSDLYSIAGVEQTTKRIFFPYGPILTKTLPDSTKSGLGVIPALFGRMPDVVDTMHLRERLFHFSDSCGLRKFEPLDQLYVNYYSVSCGAYIDFHHDHHTSMTGLIAGVNLGSDFELSLRASELPSRVPRPPTMHVGMPSKSGYLMTGLSRWHLQHAVLDLVADRISLTFRTVDRSCVSHPSLWDREWSDLTDPENANAHYPILPPP